MIDRYLKLFYVGVLILISAVANAQDNSNALKYTIQYDDPYDLRKLFVHFQPMYGDLAAINATGGFGIEANYYHDKIFDVTLGARTTYGKRFDITEDAAARNASTDNPIGSYYYVELGGTYHIKDFATESASKVLLYNKRLKGVEWASTVAQKATIKSKVRQIIGVRAGGFSYRSAVGLNRVLKEQNIELQYSSGSPVELDNMYTTISSHSIYLGGSMSWFRNYAVDFEKKWDASGDDLLFTTYLDFAYSPSITLDDLRIFNEQTSTTEIIDVTPVKKQPIGVKAGMTGKFNRNLGWGYGAELGMRPGLQKRTFFMTLKLSFPIYGTKLENELEVVNTETGE